MEVDEITTSLRKAASNSNVDGVVKKLVSLPHNVDSFLAAGGRGSTDGASSKDEI